MNRLVIAALIVLFPLAATYADVLGYTVERSGRDTLLKYVIIDSDTGAVAYDASRLVGARLIHFNSPHNRNLLQSADSAIPDADSRAGLLADKKLNTGIINPGGSTAPLRQSPKLSGSESTPAMGIGFDPPITNRSGDDIVVFEIQRGDSPPGGDAFHIGPVELTAARRAIMVASFDVGFNHPSACSVEGYVPYVSSHGPRSLKELCELPLRPETSPGGFKVLAVGIDLSDLGFADGEAVSRLFLQDAGSASASVDPVLIAGLPEPVAPNVLAELPEFPQSKPDPSLAELLDGSLASVEEIVFAERIPGNDHWYANFGQYWCGREEYPDQCLTEDWRPDPIFKPGGRLCRLHLRSGRLRVLLDDASGGVRDPQVHYDGRRIVFSYRPGDQLYYHLYEINADGSGLRQLTDGPFDDIEPTYLPDGDILFCSSRANRVVNCWRTPVATLHRCDADGGNVREISTNIEHDNTPWLLPDGRVLYMRWEYVDRNQLAFHHLWTINPDGTGQMVYYGNQYPGTNYMNSRASATPGKHPGIVMLDAKPIPGTRKVVASFSPSHGRPEHMGVITIVDPSIGPDDQEAARPISRSGALYRDPYPVSQDCFLIADAAGIHALDLQGNTVLIHPASGGLQCHEPRPLQSRPRENVLPSRVEPQTATGNLVLSDLYEGRNMTNVHPGEIKRLLVLEQLPKPVNFSGGPWPLSAGGSFSLARVLGTVPVAPDGSASFDVPAMRSVFFVALDEQGRSVKRMQSFVTVQPGETTSCVGCHEQRVRSPHVQGSLMALDRRPSKIEPFADAPDVVDFHRDVQPILDRHCVTCHNPDRYEGRIDLCGDHTPMFSQSYWTLLQRGLIADGRNEPYGNRGPRQIGSSASRLLDLADGSHYAAQFSPSEMTIVRLWIETGATYTGTYAALGSGMHPVDFPEGVIQRRCASCHGHDPGAKSPIGQGPYYTFGGKGPALPLVHEFADLKQIRGTMGYFKSGRSRTPQSLCNLIRPEKSILLRRAPLSADAGGLGICSGTVFADQSDDEFQVILAAIQSAGERHAVEKRFDMPGFRPNDHYLIQMQRFGIISKSPAGDDRIDVFATDQAYWQSFWYRPRR